MSWSRHILAAFLLALGLSGCGFHPMYGRLSAGQGATSAEMQSIRVLAIEDRKGQILRNALVERLTPRGEPATPRYTLKVALTESLGGLGQRKDATATLGEMLLSASFVLSPRGAEEGSGHMVTGAVSTVVSVNYLGPRYGSVAVERDAEERALVDLAEAIRNNIAARLERPVDTQKAIVQ